MFEGFQTFAITTQDDPEVTIRGLVRRISSNDTSSNPSNPSNPSPNKLSALLLLHGFPQSHHIWHRVVEAPQLAGRFSAVVIPDLRGYGESSKPEGVDAYAKSAMARDCVAVMDGLGLGGPGEGERGGDDDDEVGGSFFVCAHDRGARVAHKLCVDHPSRVRRAVLLDICPTLAMYSATDRAFAAAYFHWFFLIQPPPLPETMISGNARLVAEMFMGGRQKGGVGIFDLECFDYYVKSLGDPDTVHASERAMCPLSFLASCVFWDVVFSLSFLFFSFLRREVLAVPEARRTVIQNVNPGIMFLQKWLT